MADIYSTTTNERDKTLHELLICARRLYMENHVLEALKPVDEAIRYVEDFFNLDFENIQTQMVLSTFNPVHIAVAQGEVALKDKCSLRVIPLCVQELYKLGYLYARGLGSEHRQRVSEYVEKEKAVGFVCASPYLHEVEMLMEDEDFDVEQVMGLLNQASLYIADSCELMKLYSRWLEILDIEKQPEQRLDLLRVFIDIVDSIGIRNDYCSALHKLQNQCAYMNLNFDDVLKSDAQKSRQRLMSAGINLDPSPYLLAYVTKEIKRYSKTFMSLGKDVYKAAVALGQKPYLDSLGYCEGEDEVQFLDNMVELNSNELILVYTQNLREILPDEIVRGVSHLESVCLLVLPQEIWSVPRFSLIGLVDIKTHRLVKEINTRADVTLDFCDLEFSKFERVNKKCYLPYLKVIPNFKKVDYEECVARILQENRYFMHIFIEELEAMGLKEKTVRRHIANINIYLNSYIAHYLGKSVLVNPDISGFIDYLSNDISSYSISSLVKSNLASIKKFFKCLYDHGIITKSQYHYVLDEIKFSRDWWIADVQYSNNPYSY